MRTSSARDAWRGASRRIEVNERVHPANKSGDLRMTVEIGIGRRRAAQSGVDFHRHERVFLCGPEDITVELGGAALADDSAL